MNDALPNMFFTVGDAEAAKNLTRERVRRETRLSVEFAVRGNLLALPPEDIVDSVVEFNGYTLKVSSWRDAWDAEKGLQRFFTAHELE